MKSKIIYLAIPENKYRSLVNLCSALDIDIVSIYEKDSLFSENILNCALKVQKDSEISLELKEEKLKEKFGKYIDDKNDDNE
jgi:hypothetical protein